MKMEIIVKNQTIQTIFALFAVKKNHAPQRTRRAQRVRDLFKKDRFIVQGPVDENHVMRVVIEIKDNIIKIITFYPARRERYENQL